MADPHEVKNGKITIYKRSVTGTLQTLEFEETYIFQFSESIVIAGSNTMTTPSVISAKKSKMGTAKHENTWPTNS